MSFSEAFKKARKEKGPGKTFTWQGKSYSTNYAGEKDSDSNTSKRPKARPEKKSGNNPTTRPKARPSEDKGATSKRPKARPTSTEKDTSSGPPRRPVNTKAGDERKRRSEIHSYSKDSRKPPSTNKQKSPALQRIKDWDERMTNRVTPAIKEILGIGADMPPQQPTSSKSRKESRKK